MTDEILHNRSSDNRSPDPYISTVADLVNRNDLVNQRLEGLTYEVQRLHSQLGWLRVLSVAALILAGVLAGLTLSMKLQQDEQTQKFGTLTGDRAGVENQVNSLNQQLASLNQQVTSLNQQVTSINQQVALKASQAQLKPLQAIIQDINSRAITSDQLNAALQRVEQKLNNQGQSSAPSPAPSQFP